MAKITPVRASECHVYAEDSDCRREIVLVEHTLKIITDELEALHEERLSVRQRYLSESQLT